MQINYEEIVCIVINWLSHVQKRTSTCSYFFREPGMSTNVSNIIGAPVPFHYTAINNEVVLLLSGLHTPGAAGTSELVRVGCRGRNSLCSR